MKTTLKTTIIKTLSWTIFGVAALLLISSCKKDDGYDFDGSVNAKVQLINASPDAGSAQLFVANILRTPNAVSYGDASGYNATYTGQQDVSARNASGNILASTNTQIDAANNYSYFLSGSNGSLSLIVAKDDTVPAASGKAKIRFVHAGSSSTAVDVLANGVSLFTALTNKAVSNYSEVAAGSYTFKVTNTGTAIGLASSSAVTLESGKNYTVYTKGVAGTEGAGALGIAVIKIN